MSKYTPFLSPSFHQLTFAQVGNGQACGMAHFPVLVRQHAGNHVEGWWQNVSTTQGAANAVLLPNEHGTNKITRVREKKIEGWRMTRWKREVAATKSCANQLEFLTSAYSPAVATSSSSVLACWSFVVQSGSSSNTIRSYSTVTARTKST